MERQMLRTEVKHYIEVSDLAYSYNKFYAQNMPDKVAWETLQSDLFANLPQIKAERMPQDFSAVLPKLWRKTSGMGCRAYKTPALPRRRKVAHHAGKKESLVGMEALPLPIVWWAALAVACCWQPGHEK